MELIRDQDEMSVSVNPEQPRNDRYNLFLSCFKEALVSGLGSDFYYHSWHDHKDETTDNKTSSIFQY